MALTLVLHRVTDYDAWRRVYDEFEAMQKAGGVTAESVYRAKGDPNNVLVLHHFGSMSAAEAFVASPELHEAMQKAGVEGTPRIEFFEESE
ncbi:MAG: cyclase [Chloroflexi bacterium]|nr:cyclase [Chloroflexota bacterium]